MRQFLSSEMRNFLLHYLPPLVWAAVIFLFSATPSDHVGSYSADIYLERKGAHVTEYAVFAFLLFRVFALHAPKKVLESALLAAAVALLYAASDEIHQLFVFGREGKISDVLIDSAGIILGLTVALFRTPKE